MNSMESPKRSRISGTSSSLVIEKVFSTPYAFAIGDQMRLASAPLMCEWMSTIPKPSEGKRAASDW